MAFTRRGLLQKVGTSVLASGVSMGAPKHLKAGVARVVQAAGSGSAGSGKLRTYENLPIRVNNPTKLKTWSIPAVRTEFSEGYKPSLAELLDGELVMVALMPQEKFPGNKMSEKVPLWRSKDGGHTWSGPVILEDVIGREHWLTCTSDGTLLTTCHLLENDVNNPYGFTHSYLHRSTDRGRTWQRTRIVLEGLDEKLGTHAGRNILELPDKTLLLGVSINRTDVAYLWSSKDGGETWSKGLRVKIGDYRNKPYSTWGNIDGFLTENWLYRTTSGRLLNFFRTGSCPMFPMEDERVPPEAGDPTDRTLFSESADGGRTWTDLRDFSDYGMHYPRVLRLRDGRLLMTITQRALFYPLGLQAILSYDDGETWHWNTDRIIIEGKTPWGGFQGGGFGNTLQLKDDSLLSCYSYRGEDQKTYIETVRWKLPA